MNRRKIELDFSTCWGTTNFTRVAGWIMWGLRDHFDQKSRFDIKLGNGVVDNIQRVGRREADLGIITPTANLNLAREGRGPFTTAYPDLVVLGRLGHDDRLTCAAASHVKIKSLHDVVSQRLPVRIAADLDDDGASVAFACNEILKFYGLTEDRLKSWGGGLVRLDRGPAQGVEKVINGHADILIHEAVMLKPWFELIHEKGGKFVSFDQPLLDHLSKSLGYGQGKLPSTFGYAGDDVDCVDWADWLVVARRDMDSEIAYRIAQVMVEKKLVIENQYRWIPIKYSPLIYPIDVKAMFETPGVEYHEGALRYYADHHLNQKAA
jgi:TRAP-type uncharacterized transport system substrate-binding protein